MAIFTFIGHLRRLENFAFAHFFFNRGVFPFCFHCCKICIHILVLFCTVGTGEKTNKHIPKSRIPSFKKPENDVVIIVC